MFRSPPVARAFRALGLVPIAIIAIGLGCLVEPTPDPASPEPETPIRVGLPTPSPTNSVAVVTAISTPMPEPSEPPTATPTVQTPTFFPAPFPTVVPATATPSHTPVPAETPETPILASPTPTPSPTALSTVPAPTPDDPRESTVGLSITDFAHQSITVRPGTTVIWTNAGFNAHTVIQGLPFGGVSRWGSPLLPPGASFSFHFDLAGVALYYCRIHPTLMPAAILVAE